MPPKFRDLVEMVEVQAAKGALPAFTFLKDGRDTEVNLSFAELFGRAKAIAAALAERGLGGKRVLLLFNQGLEFVEAFYGCILAGATAVPAYPPTAALDRSMPRLDGIVGDCDAAAVMCTRTILDSVGAKVLARGGAAAALPWLVSTELARLEGDWRRPEVSPSDIAMLQYTSGSVGEPKGVMLSHRNLLHNQHLIEASFGELVGPGVSWLPLYHDMGLIGHVVQPLFQGTRSVLMTPFDFLRSPYAWLRAISKYRAYASGAPNFAWDLCTRKVSESDAAKLDLSSWGVAYCGAEPIRVETLRRFADRFESVGFSRKAFLPCYGLAESCLMVSGNRFGSGYVTRDVDDAQLGLGGVATPPRDAHGFKRVVGCGKAGLDVTLSIVDPESLRTLPPDAVGEIWIQSPSIAEGYWGRRALSEEVFRAHQGGRDGFLRTGDLGFIDSDGELFVTGRLKDLLILQGRNFYPQDLERAAEDSHGSFRPNSAVATTIESGQQSELVLVLEFERRWKPLDAAVSSERREVALAPGELNSVVLPDDKPETLDPQIAIEAAKLALAELSDLQPFEIVLVKPGHVPKTTSGKVRRSETKKMLEAGEFDVIARWTRPRIASLLPARNSSAPPAPLPAAIPADQDSMEAAIRAWVKENAKIDVDPTQSFSSLGIDSSAAVKLARHLETLLARKVPPTLLWDYPTVRELAAYLLKPVKAKKPRPLPLPKAPEEDAFAQLLDETSRDRSKPDGSS